jgi:hypothetical protein
LILAFVLLAGIAVVWRQRSRRAAGAPEAAPWPPFEPVAAPVTEPLLDHAPEAVAEPAPEPSARWLAPIDGSCPDGYPIKANDNSRIYHVPGGRFYVRTVPERCYATAEDAEADGYRRAKA